MSYDREKSAAPVPGLRLLPWVTDMGKPCFLSVGDGPSVLAPLADAAEEEQLCDADAAFKDGQEVLSDSTAGVSALRQALEASNLALSDVLRVADSRGDRLTNYEEAEEDGRGRRSGRPFWSVSRRLRLNGGQEAPSRVSLWVSFMRIRRRSPRFARSSRTRSERS